MFQLDSAAMFLVAIVAQVIAASLLPHNDGFSSLLRTMACVGSNVISFALIAILIRRGVGWAIIVPAFAAAVPWR